MKKVLIIFFNKINDKNIKSKEIYKLIPNNDKYDYFNNPSTNNNYAINWASKNGHIDVVNRLLKDTRVDPSTYLLEKGGFASLCSQKQFRQNSQEMTIRMMSWCILNNCFNEDIDNKLDEFEYNDLIKVIYDTF